jgi:DNA-binding NarL/FixJ family response regulator
MDPNPGTMLSREVWRTLALAAHGFTTAEVADRLGLDLATVRHHIFQAMSVLGTTSKLETVVVALRLGLIALTPA